MRSALRADADRIEGLSGAELSRARLTLRWPDSDPLRIETTCEAFQLVPEGVVRVWTVDGSAPRSGARRLRRRMAGLQAGAV